MKMLSNKSNDMKIKLLKMATTIYVEVNFYNSLSDGLVAVILLFSFAKTIVTVACGY